MNWQGKDVLFALLTVRTSDGRTTVPATTEKPETVPSKQAGDNTRILRTTDEDGNVLPDPFELAIAPETDLIKQELARLNEHLKTKNLPALEWLPEESQSEIRFLLGDQADKLQILDYGSPHHPKLPPHRRRRRCPTSPSQRPTRRVRLW